MQEKVKAMVIVHPLVLLSVTDHFNRINKSDNQRVAGALLGTFDGTTYDVSNSFAIPFDENSKDPSVWFMDHTYLESMYGMFSKVNAKEKIIGWYHTGPKLRVNDVEIHQLVQSFFDQSILLIIDVKPVELGLPTQAYMLVEELHNDGTPTSKTFVHYPSQIGAEEAEEIGVEHLLRDVKDTIVASLSTNIDSQMDSVKRLKDQLEYIHAYMEDILCNKLPADNQIMYILQEIFNLLPNLESQNLVDAFNAKSNEQNVSIYIASLIQSVLALHTLIENKIDNQKIESIKLHPKADLKLQHNSS